MTVKALIFDLDDTLVEDEVSATTAFLKTCLYAQTHYGINLPGFHGTIRDVCRSYWHQSPAREYCVQVGISSWEGLWAEFKGSDKNLKILQKWAPIYRKLSWLTTLQRFSIDDEDFALELADKYIASRRELHIVYNDAVQNLEKFKPHYRMGLLTNGAPDLQRRKIAATGLGKYFDAIVIAGEFGVGKPDKRIYEKMLSMLDVTPESALMIGDNLKSDISGAQAAGIKAAWLNRTKSPANHPILPDFIFENLDEMKETLGLESGSYSNN